jgi:hypothetical protein
MGRNNKSAKKNQKRGFDVPPVYINRMTLPRAVKANKLLCSLSNKKSVLKSLFIENNLTSFRPFGPITVKKDRNLRRIFK